MRKIIAAINMSLDGYCDHDKMTADDETHEHYSDLLRDTDTLIYGRTTYQLMENYWPDVVKEPTGNQSTDDFAVLIDDIKKIVYSRSLNNVTWKNSELKNEIVKEEILDLKNQNGKSIGVGSPGLIVQFFQLGLIDEFQLAIHPTVLGGGLSLFKNIRERIDLKLLKNKTFNCGVVIHYYECVNK